jgi:hypothetical protein
VRRIGTRGVGLATSQAAYIPAVTNLQHMIEQATILSYRFGTYAMLNLADDAAMLALMFC